jgi:ferredoxin like protein
MNGKTDTGAAEALKRVEEREANVGLADKLYKVKYKTDELTHLKIKDQEVCRKCEDKPCIARCPAEVYEWEAEHGQVLVAFENCLECGVCKIVCPYDNIDWVYPRGGYGVVWKFG